MPKKTKIFLLNLGCPKNQVDGEVIQGSLEQADYEFVDDLDKASVAIVNTCGFIESAKQESLDALIELLDLKKTGAIERVYLAGCLGKRYAKELGAEFPDLDGRIPLDGLATAPQVLSGAAPAAKGPERPDLHGWVNRAHAKGPTAYLKIADGCDNRCAYCAIPGIRGPFLSLPLEGCLAQARRLAEDGVRELILVAQDTTLWGRDLPGQPDLADLLKALGALGSFPWIRVMYAHPAHLSDRIVSALATTPGVLPYLDLPLQHIADPLLKRMNRHIDAAGVRRVVEQLHTAMPTLALRTTFLLGFPGETPKDIALLSDFVAEGHFEHVGAFAYSPEEGTPAVAFEKPVGSRTAQKRVERILEAQSAVVFDRAAQRVGEVHAFLPERPDPEHPGMTQGRLWFQAPEIDGEAWVSGVEGRREILRVRITRSLGYDYEGEAV